MSDYTAQEVHEKVDAVYWSDSRRVLAILIRPLGDFPQAWGLYILQAAPAGVRIHSGSLNRQPVKQHFLPAGKSRREL